MQLDRAGFDHSVQGRPDEGESVGMDIKASGPGLIWL